MAEQTKPPPLNKRGGCWFRLGTAIVHVGVETDFRPQKKAHPAFAVQNLDELKIKLEAAGHTVIWDHAFPGRRRFYTTDPFENRIEFISDGDGFSDHDTNP